MTDRAESPAAEKIRVGPWTISARRTPAGALSIEVLLRDAPRAKIELDEGGVADGSRRSKLEARSKSEVDMDL
jgi:hypothetical protein